MYDGAWRTKNNQSCPIYVSNYKTLLHTAHYIKMFNHRLCKLYLFTLVKESKTYMQIKRTHTTLLKERKINRTGKTPAKNSHLQQKQQQNETTK